MPNYKYQRMRIDYTRLCALERQEERANNPTRMCDLCPCKVKLEHWENHCNLPSHKIERLRREYKPKIEQAQGKEKKRLEKEFEEKTQEIRDAVIPLYKKEPEEKTNP